MRHIRITSSHRTFLELSIQLDLANMLTAIQPAVTILQYVVFQCAEVNPTTLFGVLSCFHDIDST